GCCHAPLQSHRGSPHYQAMIRSLRAALGRFCLRRAAASQRDAPRRALTWLKLGARFAPGFADTYPALVHPSRALDHWAAAGGGATALWHNAQALYDAGDHEAADEALNLWATQVPDGHSRLPEARAELRAKAAARAQVQ